MCKGIIRNISLGACKNAATINNLSGAYLPFFFQHSAFVFFCANCSNCSFAPVLGLH